MENFNPLYSYLPPEVVKILKEKRNVENIGDIISSIQQNQNKIITEKISKNLIVQGCAGSGKTINSTEANDLEAKQQQHERVSATYNNPGQLR